jgi:hypothetical protein
MKSFFCLAYLFRSWQTQDLPSKIWQTLEDVSFQGNLQGAALWPITKFEFKKYKHKICNFGLNIATGF